MRFRREINRGGEFLQMLGIAKHQAVCVGQRSLYCTGCLIGTLFNKFMFPLPHAPHEFLPMVRLLSVETKFTLPYPHSGGKTVVDSDYLLETPGTENSLRMWRTGKLVL